MGAYPPRRCAIHKPHREGQLTHAQCIPGCLSHSCRYHNFKLKTSRRTKSLTYKEPRSQAESELGIAILLAL